MNKDNLFTFDDMISGFDLSELDTYEWWPFPNHDNAWLSRRPFHHDTGGWDTDTPKICKDMYEISKQAFKRINPNCEIIEVTRCMIHKFLPSNEMFETDIHRDDFLADHWSTVIYVKGSGSTDFFLNRDETTAVTCIEFVPGRISIFPAGYWHRPGIPSKEYRITVSFTFKVLNLVKELNGVRQPCMCGKSAEQPYCDGSHNPY